MVCYDFLFWVNNLEIVILTALGVGLATVFGAIIGFVFRNLTCAVSDYILALSAGVMLSSAVTSLVLPSIEYSSVWLAIIFVILGAVGINLLDRAGMYFLGLNGNPELKRYRRVMMFVLAIALHNFPEGIAAGVGFGTGNIGDAVLIAGGIALHNVPEGMVIISPMIAAGVKPGRALGVAMGTGAFEIFGTMFGYFAVNLSGIVLAPALALAGGMMLYVICDEMIPEARANGKEKGVSYALIVGFCLILGFGELIS